MTEIQKARAAYSPIISRKPLKLPGGARLRVGFWRLKKILDQHQVRATLGINAPVCDTYPIIVEEGLRNGWEILAHGYEQRAINLEEDERAVIRKTIKTIRDCTGRAPRGWMGPGLQETYDTPDILAEEGFEYVADWVNDDQPYPLKVKSGRLIAVPYTVEVNDIVIYAVEHHSSPEIYNRARDAFDTLYEEAADSARFMGISMHPYVMGAAHRVKYLDKIIRYIKEHERVAFMTGEEILDWYNNAAA
jgi:allantoinase